jgi:hypothetical protein
MSTIDHSYDALCRALRRLPEDLLNFPRLARVDLDEAVGNIESSLSHVLTTYHSLYDASHGRFEWIHTPQALALIAIRNARHHNKGNRIRSFIAMAFHHEVHSNEDYWQIIYDGHTDTSFPHALADLIIFLNHKDNRLSGKKACAIRKYLHIDENIAEFAERNILPDNVFFDIMPVIRNAAKAAVEEIGESITALSFDGCVYLDHFRKVDYIDMAISPIARLPKTLAGQPY